MNIDQILFQATDWSNIPFKEYPGETGVAYWRTIQYGKLRIRIVEYSQNYRADHWCEKGHIVYCIEGRMVSELSDGRIIPLSKGMTYQVSDGASSHRSISSDGVKLLIIDGDFLKKKTSLNPWKG
jgi:hypothetical protein